MRAVDYDHAKYDEMLKVLQGIVQHRKAQSSSKSEELFYELVSSYHQRVKNAKESGGYIVGISSGVPIEIFYAMDIVPFHLWWGAMGLVPTLKLYEQSLDISKQYGLPSEMCSAQRHFATVVLKRWVPTPDLVVWATHTCESTNKSGQICQHLWGTPSLFLERPEYGREPDIKVYGQELEDMVGVLEERTGRRLDLDRLRETVKISKKMIDLHQQTYELRKAVPSPAVNRRQFQYHMINRLYAGTPEGLSFVQAVYDEYKELVDRGVGPYPVEEKFRLLSLFLYASHDRKVVDWLQMERGATFVADPLQSSWGDFEMDLSHPIETLSRIYYAEPHSFTMMGPSHRAQDVAAKAATEFKADGAVWWAHRGCKQGCGLIRMVKDALQERAGIPTVVIDMDINDPSFVSHDEIREKLEGFLELLEDRK